MKAASELIVLSRPVSLLCIPLDSTMHSVGLYAQFFLLPLSTWVRDES